MRHLQLRKRRQRRLFRHDAHVVAESLAYQVRQQRRPIRFRAQPRQLLAYQRLRPEALSVLSIQSATAADDVARLVWPALFEATSRRNSLTRLPGSASWWFSSSWLVRTPPVWELEGSTLLTPSQPSTYELRPGMAV